jgi:hypothetical protein
MYYLFIRNENELKKYKAKLLKVKENINNGKTPVFNELQNAKTNLTESMPYNTINGALTILSVFLLRRIEINEMLKIAVVLIINHISGAIAEYVFVFLKHILRCRLCKRLAISPDDDTIAAMESLEYQTV